MSCGHKLGDLRCSNENPHEGHGNGGCVFVASRYGPDWKEANNEGVVDDD